MKTKFLLFVLLFATGCGTGHRQTGAKLKGVSYAGGDGSSIERAVIIKATDSLAGVRAELKWIRRNYPNWQLEQQSELKVKGRVYDKMDFIAPDGRRKTLYFDITSFYGKL